MMKPSIKNPTGVHKTISGHVECVGEWGRGKAAEANFAKMPAVIICDDGDGHYSAHRYTGKRLDAAKVLAQFLTKDRRYCVEFGGFNVTAVDRPDDFYIELDGDEFAENPKYAGAFVAS